MRVVKMVAAACVLLLGRPLFAQEWARYQNLDDRFAVTDPGQPTIEKIMWKSEYDPMFPATVYRWQQGPNRLHGAYCRLLRCGSHLHSESAQR